MYLNISEHLMPINRTSAEQEAFCKAWKQSGLSKTEFCKQSNISKSALYAWLNKFNDTYESSKADNKNNHQSAAVKFLRINDVNSDRNLRHEDKALEIVIPNGIAIKINLSQNNLNIFLQELLKWK
jgi:hypothetical protein